MYSLRPWWRRNRRIAERALPVAAILTQAGGGGFFLFFVLFLFSVFRFFEIPKCL